MLLLSANSTLGTGGEMRALAKLVQNITNTLLFRKVLVGGAKIDDRPLIVIELRHLLKRMVFVTSVATFREVGPRIVQHDWYNEGAFHMDGSEATNNNPIDIPAWAFPSIAEQVEAGLHILDKAFPEEKPTYH